MTPLKEAKKALLTCSLGSVICVTDDTCVHCYISAPILPCTSASSAAEVLVEVLTSCPLSSDHQQIRLPNVIE